MKKIYLIRHGQASFGKHKYDKLSNIGKEQTRLLKNYFKKNKTIFNIVASGKLNRQIETAHISLNKKNIFQINKNFIDPNFNEINSSDTMLNKIALSMKNNSSLKNKYKNIHTNYNTINKIFKTAKKVKITSRNKKKQLHEFIIFEKKVQLAFKHLKSMIADKENAIIFTSSGPIGIILKQILNLPQQKMFNLGREILNSSITILNYDNKILQTIIFNSVPHINIYNFKKLLTYI